jgi:hypothetical protein
MYAHSTTRVGYGSPLLLLLLLFLLREGRPTNTNTDWTKKK